MINIITLTLWIYYGHFTLQLLFALIVPLYQGPQEFITHVSQDLFLLTFCKTRGLSCVRQAELALLPAAIVTDQGVVGLFDVHIIANAEHVTGSLDV